MQRHVAICQGQGKARYTVCAHLPLNELIEASDDR
jgi:hypothetical protein